MTQPNPAASEPLVASIDERDLVQQLYDATKWCIQYHTEYQGKAMPDAIYDKFATLRDERIPALKAELRAALATPVHQAAEPAPSELQASIADYVLSRGRGTSGRIILERHEEEHVRSLAASPALRATGVPAEPLPIAPKCAPCADEPDGRCCGTGECWTCPLNTNSNVAS